MIVFHSDHPSHLLKLPINRIAVRKPSPSSENPHCRRLFRRPFLTTFPTKSFSDTDHTIRCTRRRSSTFLKAPEEESQPRTGHTRLFSAGLNLTRRRMGHFPATRFHLQPRLTPSSHPPSALVSSEP